MLLSLVAMLALVTLGGLAATSVSGGIRATGHARFEAMGLYAAESGAAAGKAFLRANIDPVLYWSKYVNPGNAPSTPATIFGNGSRPGATGNPFSADTPIWYEVSVINNPGDPEIAEGGDSDARVILRATGHAPGNTAVTIEVEVHAAGVISLGGRPCPGYGQRGLGEDGAGRNDCLETISSTDTSVFHPDSEESP